VLSAILLEREAFDRVQETLRSEHFYSEANRRVYEAAEALATAGSPIDIVSIASWLRDRERLAQIGGPSYLAQLADATPAVAHVAAHAQVVFEKWRVRQLIATCQRISAEGYGDVGVVQEYIDGADKRDDGQELPELLKTAFETLAATAARGERISGTSTGIERLDAKIAGLHDGDLLIIAGRPGQGKTSCVLNIAVNVASPHEVQWTSPTTGELRRIEHCVTDKVAVFSLEMPRDQLTMRLACSEARVDLGRVRQGTLQTEDWRRLTEAAAFLHQVPIWIDDTPALTILDLRAKVRRLQAEYDRPATDDKPARRVGLVIVDYLQLMKGREGASSREQEISEISRGLKQLAKELRVPVIALSQLNRSVETRTTKDKRPQLSDLRDSGSIEQDADTVIFIYRHSYYFPDDEQHRGIAELIVAKQRNGPTGKVLTRFTASCTRFDNLAQEDYPEMQEDE
jgi:replicative DNA helicase